MAKPSKDEMKAALKDAFKACHYREPNEKESARIEKAVDNHGTPGRPKKK